MKRAAADTLSQYLQRAERCCSRRGARLTAQRRRVLQILWSRDRPLGAYEILEIMGRELPNVAPPTVYRALEFLCAQGLAHKLETLHAYVGCRHPEHPHSGQFLICTCCGDVTELEDSRISESVGKAAAASGFRPRYGVIEVSGTCAGCVGAK